MFEVMVAFPLLSVMAGEGRAWGVGLDPPPALVSVQAKAARAIDHVERCESISVRFGFEARFRAITRRYYEVLWRAEGVWGRAFADPADWFDWVDDPVICRPDDILATMDAADRALDETDFAFSEATQSVARGAWLGSIKLCRDTVARAHLRLDRQTDRPVLQIAFRPRYAEALGILTERSVNARLAVRLDGRVISEPAVYERIDGGQISLAGDERSNVAGLGKAIRGKC